MSAPLAPDPQLLEALAEFAAGAGHEINNPLATIIGRAQQLLKDERDPQRRQSLATIAAQAYRIRDMIGDVMTFARPPEPRLGAVDLAAAVQAVVTRLAADLQAGRCRVQTAIPPGLSLRADAAQLAIVVSELLRNALTALQPDGGEIAVAADAADATVRLTFTDRGRGFTESERRHAFDPFFSGRQAGRGLGFGLCKVWQIVRRHGARIEISAPPGGPTVVRLEWPQTA